MAVDIIRISHLVKEFKTANGVVHALDDVNLSIRHGEIYGIIGLSGAGKSTLVRCINYLERPTSGDVFFDSVSLSQMKERDRREVRRSMGMIFQQFNLLEQRNVLKNVCFPLELGGMKRVKAEARARELLNLVGLADREKAYPAQLSGGQKQRVAIARAIATEPRVLLCDEATSALDPNTTESILNLIRDINRTLGITVVMITHQMSVIEAVCDRVAIIDQSRIAEEGEVQRIFSAPQSKIGRELILGGDVRQEEFGASKKIRVTFDGRSAFEPVIANMILGCQLPVNILFAATKEIGGKAAGQMVLQLPENEADAMKLIHYLRERGVNLEEVKNSDF